jgi:heat shock protein HslJ/uncharacterized lipoprotein YbaY/uncharacterized lipoprotein NlpE involved in copper resistance
MIFLSGCTSNPPQADDATIISGTAAYRQRIAMPPEAVLSVRVNDVSHTDAQSPVLAETSEPFGDRQVPIEFSLQVPSIAIDASHSYNLQATITVNGEQRFTTTRSYPTLTRGAGNKVDLMLDAVQPSVSGQTKVGAFATPTTESSASFTLPATFSGVTPCADCPGIAETLTLRSDGLFLLRRIYQDKSVSPFVEHGRWTMTADKLVLTNASGTQNYTKISDDTLRKLDSLGQPIVTSANIDLNRAAMVDPISETHEWRGEFRYMADAATFTDCASGIRWPVAMTGDYLATERNYLKSRNIPGSPLLVTFEGRLEQRPGMEEGISVEQLVIEKFNGPQPKAACASAASGKGTATANLQDTYWNLLELDGKKIPIAPSHKRQIRITLASEGSRVTGFSGCNQFTGTFRQSGNELKFSQMAGTMMACVSPYMALEQQVLKMLGATTAYRIEGEQLFLLNENKVIAF